MIRIGRPRITVWRVRIACWITKAKTHTHNMYYLSFFQCNNGFIFVFSTPLCYIKLYELYTVDVCREYTTDINHQRTTQHNGNNIVRSASNIIVFYSVLWCFIVFYSVVWNIRAQKVSNIPSHPLNKNFNDNRNNKYSK
jgi:hypothetical protein